jgi:hypothetical protein
VPRQPETAENNFQKVSEPDLRITKQDAIVNTRNSQNASADEFPQFRLCITRLLGAIRPRRRRNRSLNG